MIPNPSAPTIGLRNNNPGNLKAGMVIWKGETGNADGFIIFDTMENGTRAIAKCLHTYIFIEKLRTINQIISRYAPETENDTAAYVLDACRHVGAHPDNVIEWNLPNIRNLIAAIVEHENGAVGWVAFVSTYGGMNTIELTLDSAGWKFDATGESLPWWNK